MEKQLRVIKWHLIKYSKDPQIQQLYHYRLSLDRLGHIGRGNRTSPCLTLERLEKARVLERFVGAGQQGHKGLGSRPRKIYRKVDSRKDIMTRMKNEAEEKRLIILHQYELQASWLSWGLNEMMKYDFSWNSLQYSYTDRLLKFVLNAQTNTLPTPDNLRRWGLKRNVACGLCGKQEVTLSHVLGGCDWVRESENKLFREDRFTWRHNNILHKLYLAIKEHIATVRKFPEKKGGDLIKFIPAGGSRASVSSTPKLGGILSQARDWELDFDLPELHSPLSRYVFPHDVCATPLKLDGYILSRKKRILIALELTVPMEHNMAVWHRVKTVKYENEIRLEAEKKNWSFHCLVVEVGARGWVPPSLVSALNKLGLLAVNKLSNHLSLLAQKSSYIIWLNRFNRDFSPWRLPDDSTTKTTRPEIVRRALTVPYPSDSNQGALTAGVELPVEQASNSKSLWEDVNQTVIPNVDLVDGKCEGKRSLPPESGSEVVYSSDAKSAAVSYKALKDLVTSLVNKLPLDSASAEPSVKVLTVLDVDRLFAYFTDPSHPSPSNGN